MALAVSMSMSVRMALKILMTTCAGVSHARTAFLATRTSSLYWILTLHLLCLHWTSAAATVAVVRLPNNNSSCASHSCCTKSSWKA